MNFAPNLCPKCGNFETFEKLNVPIHANYILPPKSLENVIVLYCEKCEYIRVYSKKKLKIKTKMLSV